MTIQPKRVMRARINRNAAPTIRSLAGQETKRITPAAFLAALNPSDVYPYCHSMRQLRKRPLTPSAQAYIRENCDSLSVHRHGQLVSDKRGRFHQVNIYPFRERLQVVGPNPEVYKFLASLDDRIPDSTGKLPEHDLRPPLITCLEITLDIILSDEKVLRTAFDALKRCFVQRWNGKHETVEFGNGGMSTGRRWPGRYFTAYISKPSPVTGEVDCLHLEYRICSARAVRDIEVQSVSDLLTFDHTRFWKKNLVFLDIDFRRLGRNHRNKAEKRKRQKPDIDDRRIGQSLWRANAYDQSGSLCVQEFLKNYGPGPYLEPIPIGHLLPSSSQNASGGPATKVGKLRHDKKVVGWK